MAPHCPPDFSLAVEACVVLPYPTHYHYPLPSFCLSGLGLLTTQPTSLLKFSFARATPFAQKAIPFHFFSLLNIFFF